MRIEAKCDISALDVGGKFTSIDQVHFTNRIVAQDMRRGVYIYFCAACRVVRIHRPHISPVKVTMLVSRNGST
jgi:hypothetical protein